MESSGYRLINLATCLEKRVATEHGYLKFHPITLKRALNHLESENTVSSHIFAYAKNKGADQLQVDRAQLNSFFLFLFNVPVNNFSVMLRWSHLFLGITSTFGE